MPSYDYTIAKEVLNDADKDRIVCIYLSSDPSAIDWAKATKDFGSASVESFKKTTQNMLKKIEKAGGKIEGGAEGNGSTSPVKPAAKAAPKKRKAKGEDGAEGEKPKKRGRPAKAQKADEKVEGKSKVDDEYEKLLLSRAEDDEGENGEEVVKEEPAEEGEDMA